MFIVTWFLRLFAGNWISKLIGFFTKNWKLTVVLLLIGVVFYGGMKYEERKKNKEIAGLIEHYKEQENKREEGILKRIKEVEENSKKAAEKLAQEKEIAEKTVKHLQEAYIEETTKRQKRLQLLEAKLNTEKNLTEKQRKELEAQIKELAFVYMISPQAKDTINGFVRSYAK